MVQFAIDRDPFERSSRRFADAPSDADQGVGKGGGKASGMMDESKQRQEGGKGGEVGWVEVESGERDSKRDDDRAGCSVDGGVSTRDDTLCRVDMGRWLCT